MGKVSEQQSNVKREQNTQTTGNPVFGINVRIEEPDYTDDFGLCFDYLQGKAEH